MQLAWRVAVKSFQPRPTVHRLHSRNKAANLQSSGGLRTGTASRDVDVHDMGARAANRVCAPLLVTFTATPLIGGIRRRCWGAAKTSVIEWFQRARTRSELMTLDDLQLWDVGVLRSTAEFEVEKPLWRE